MRRIPSESVDCIICDLPYGVTNKANKEAQWDKPLPFDELWNCYKSVIKPNGAIILFGQGMFTAELMVSNKAMWRYNLVWEKDRPTGFLNANKMPLRSHEDIIVFYKKPPTYNPQFVACAEWEKNHSKGTTTKLTNRNYGSFANTPTKDSDVKHPRSVIKVKKEHNAEGFLHPTQKPVELLRYLIRTYTNEGDVVLDNCIGSGTTAVAAVLEGRSYIGFEADPKYYAVARERVAKAELQSLM